MFDQLDDLLRLIESWRVYRRMDGPIYERLTKDFALVIRSRIHGQAKT